MNSKMRYLAVLVLSVIFASLRYGIPTVQAAVEQLSSSIITEGKSPQGYPYLHGGVSSSERELMEERGKAYNVKLSFAEKRGPYLADVKLVIEGEKGGVIVNITTDGPWFYIQLPAGTYRVKAAFGEKTNEIKALRVSKDRKTQQTLIWDLGEDKDALPVR